MKTVFRLLLAGLLLSGLAGCGEQNRPATQAIAIRGEPIAPLPARDLQPPTASAPSPATSGSNSPTLPPAPQPDPQPDPDNNPDYPLAGFDRLSGYSIEIPDELLGPVTNNAAVISAKTEALIPKPVKALDKQKVALKGFMLPLKLEEGLVTEMLIMKDQSMCCFGTIPKIHEWVSVKMKVKGVKPFMDQPVMLLGTLHVGEIRENGYLTGLYEMDGEQLVIPETKPAPAR